MRKQHYKTPRPTTLYKQLKRVLNTGDVSHLKRSLYRVLVGYGPFLACRSVAGFKKYYSNPLDIVYWIFRWYERELENEAYERRIGYLFETYYCEVPLAEMLQQFVEICKDYWFEVRQNFDG